MKSSLFPFPHILFFVVLLTVPMSSICQIEKLADTIKVESLRFFCEGYVGASPISNSQKQEDFYYNHHRLNAPGINFTNIQYQVKKKRWGFDVGIQDGRYVAANYASQPILYRLISQAHLHYQPFQRHDISFQAGIFPSHIGFESAWNTDNLTLTRSMLAENSPYYESGISLSWNSPHQQWGLKALYLSGWQQSQWKWPVQHPSFGWASFWNPLPNWKLAYNGFHGNLDNCTALPYSYHNFFVQGKRKSYECIFGYDIGLKNNFSRWTSPVLIVAKSWNDQFKSAVRWEKMTDPNSAILMNGAVNWTTRSACSINLDCQLNQHFTTRIEYKYAWSQHGTHELQGDLLTFNLIYQSAWERSVSTK